MFVYKNTSRVTKTFHGVTFNPGETKAVPGYINDPKFIRVKKLPAVAQQSAKSSTNAAAEVSTASTKAATPRAVKKSQTSNKQIKSEEENE